jgi:hypothetical protein
MQPGKNPLQGFAGKDSLKNQVSLVAGIQTIAVRKKERFPE